MRSRTNTIVGRGNVAHWDEQSSIGRLRLILEYDSLFLAMGLITETELYIVREMSLTEWEYILIREKHPVFYRIDVTESLDRQFDPQLLKTALEAVFM